MPAFVLATARAGRPPAWSELYFWTEFPWIVAPCALGVVLVVALRARAPVDPAWRVIRPTLVATMAYFLVLALGETIAIVITRPDGLAGHLAFVVFIPFLDFTLAVAALTALGFAAFENHRRARASSRVRSM